MKKMIRFLFLASFCAVLSLNKAQAQQAQPPLQQPRYYNPWYIKGDVGGNVTLDTDLKEFFGEDVSGNRVKFDPGVRVGIAAGYFLTEWFAAEGEIGVFANNISEITGADHVDATYSQVPFLVNARFQCPHNGFVTPYFGGGVGGSVASIDADHIDLGGTHFDGWMS